jgi:ketosteroid isomerase-like protein
MVPDKLKDREDMSTHQDIAQAFFAGLETEGLDATVARLGAPGFSWWAAGLGEIRDMLPQIGAVIAENTDKDGLSMTVTGITADGDRVAVEAESHARLKTGTVYHNQYHFLLLFEDGKVKRVKEYNDTAHAAEIWGPLFAPLLG